MRVDAREAEPSDIGHLLDLYRSLEAEMSALHAMWPVADGLDEPIGDALAAAIDDPDTIVLVGTVDAYPFGFLIGRIEALKAQAKGERVGAIRWIYVDHDAREVAIGEEMRETAMDWFRQRGISKFDAHVLPGHRLAKNFFESGGFSARSIVMHHDDERE